MPEIVCTNCAAVNRLPPDRPAKAAKCGKCGGRLFDGKPADVSAINLDAQIRRSGIPVIVDVWAPWCGPCRVMAPAFEAAAQELEPGLRFLKLNSDNESAVSAKFGIRGIPTMLLFHNGREVARVSGAMTTAQIVAWARSQLGEAA